MQEENKNNVEAQIVNAPAETGVATSKKGDYTKYFYQNIDRLWEAVKSLQKENDRLVAQLKQASVAMNGGA